MATLLDRWMRRALPAGYNEMSYTGAEYAPGYETPGGRGNQERASADLIRRARTAYVNNGIVFAALAVRQSLFSEARFQYQALTDMHLFGDTSLKLLERPWPNADSGELLARMQLDASLGNAYIRKANPVSGDPPVLVQMRPDCVVIISEQARDTQGRQFKRPVGYAEDLRPLGISDQKPQIYTTAEVCHYSPAAFEMAWERGARASVGELMLIVGEATGDAALR